jgi:hypothetical protein
MALNGDFSAEKEHVCREMQQLLEALAEDGVLSLREKEVVVRSAVCSVFFYSAGLVNWTRTELDNISRMWAQAYKQAWTLPGCMYTFPIVSVVDQSVGGRSCPSAVSLWTCAVLEVIEQCVSLPWETRDLVNRNSPLAATMHSARLIHTQSTSTSSPGDKKGRIGTGVISLEVR